jgi:hypothetical protein
VKTLVFAQIDKIVPVRYLINHSPGIWSATVTMPGADKPDTFWVDVFGGNLDDVPETPLDIQSVLVGVVQYNKVNSLSELYQSPQAFYFDFANQILYVNYQNPYWVYLTTTAGDAITYVDKLQYDGKFPTTLTERYEPRLRLDSISVAQSIDPQEYGIFRHDNISFSLDNTDGALDTINEESAGRGCRVIYARIDDDTADIQEADLLTCRLGYVEQIEFNGTDVMITAKDSRKKWSEKINTEFFSKTYYPDLNDREVDKRIPLCIGKCYNVPCIKIDNATRRFLFSSDTYGDMVSVDQVYKDGVATAHAGTETDGTFTIAAHTNEKVTADVTGLDVSTVGDNTDSTDVSKILFLLNEFAGLAEIASNFNLNEVTAAKAISKDGGLYIGTQGKTLSECIEQLLVNNGAWLIQQGDIFTVRIFDRTRFAFREILYDELAEFPVRRYDEKEFISSITVKYRKDETEDEFYTVYDDQFEEDAIEDQARLATYELETTLLNSTDAAAVGLRFYERFYNIPATLELQVLSDISRLYPSDTITFEHVRKTVSNGELIDKVILDRANYMITEIDWIRGYIKCQYVADNLAEVYTVKYLYNDELYNDNLYA